MTTLSVSKRQAAASLALSAVAALAASTAVVAQVPERGSAKSARTCEGRVMALLWGAYVRDSRGPCVPAAVQVAEKRPLIARLPVDAAPEACVEERRWLGGALTICRDAPPVREPR